MKFQLLLLCLSAGAAFANGHLRNVEVTTAYHNVSTPVLVDGHVVVASQANHVAKIEVFDTSGNYEASDTLNDFLYTHVPVALPWGGFMMGTHDNLYFYNVAAQRVTTIAMPSGVIPDGIPQVLPNNTVAVPCGRAGGARTLLYLDSSGAILRQTDIPVLFPDGWGGHFTADGSYFIYLLASPNAGFRYDIDGNLVRQWSPGPEVAGMGFSLDGSYVFATYERIKFFDPSDVQVGEFIPSSGSVGDATRDAQGKIYITDGYDLVVLSSVGTELRRTSLGAYVSQPQLFASGNLGLIVSTVGPPLSKTEFVTLNAEGDEIGRHLLGPVTRSASKRLSTREAMRELDFGEKSRASALVWAYGEDCVTVQPNCTESVFLFNDQGVVLYSKEKTARFPSRNPAIDNGRVYVGWSNNGFASGIVGFDDIP